MRNFFKQINNHFFYLFFFTAVLVAVMLPYYADGSPALAFTDQQTKDSLLTVIGEGQKAKGERLDRRKAKGKGPKANEILFVNRSFNDLVIDLAKAEGEAKGKRLKAKWEIAGKQVEVESQKPVSVKLDKKGKGKFKVEESRIYEIWVENSQMLDAGCWILEVGGEEFEIGGERVEAKGKWVKAGEVELEKGKHRIRVGGKRLEAGGNKIGAEELRKLVRDMEIVVVSKEKLEEYKNIISQRPIGYLFHIDKEKIENMLKDKEKLKEIKLKGYNPFKIGKQEFYIPTDGSYSVKALLKPKRDFLMSDFVSSNSSSSRISLDAVSGWKINTLNTTYKQSVSEDGMHIDAYFQNKGDVKESIILNKKFSGVNIKERPYLVFSCEMEDPGVQKVEMDILLTKVKSQESKVRSWLSILSKPKKLILKADNKQYVINLHKKAEDVFGRGKVDNLYVKEVVLKFKKKDGVDLSDEKKRKIYTFIFKDIAFLKTRPILAEFEDELTAYLPDYYYYFDINGELNEMNFPEQVPWDIKDVYRLHIQRFINLKKTPVLSLNFPKSLIDSSIDRERKDFPAEWRIVLGLDFNGDEKEDNRIETLVPVSELSDSKFFLTIKAYEEAKRRFSNKKNYHLLFIGVSHPDDKEIFYQNVMSKKLIRYREHMYKPSDLKAGADVLQVDDKTYKLPSNNTKDNTDKWIDFSNVYLKKGEHNLNVMGSDKFKVEMVEIKPEIRSQK